MSRPSTLSVSLGFVVLSALVVALLPLWRPSAPTLHLRAEALPSAPLGALLLEGWLQLEQEQPYTRTYSVLGKQKVEVLRVVPITAQGWRPTDEVPALAVLRGEVSSRLFEGSAVNLGPLDPAWSAPFAVSKGATLVELIPGEPPWWWLALGGFALIVFLILAARGVIRRLSG